MNLVQNLNHVFDEIGPFLVLVIAVYFLINHYVNAMNPFKLVSSDIQTWMDNHQLTGWHVFTTLCPETVRIRSESDHWRRSGAVYRPSSHTAVIVEEQWCQSQFEWIWNACHELAHPDQTESLWATYRHVKRATELTELAGIIVFAGHIAILVPIGLITMAAGLYALVDLLPELDAILRTPHYLERVFTLWPADERVKVAVLRLTLPALRYNTWSYVRNTGLITLGLWTGAIIGGLFMRAVVFAH